MSCQLSVWIGGMGHSKLRGTNRTICGLSATGPRCNGVTCYRCVGALLTREFAPERPRNG